MELYGLQKDYAIAYLETLENATTQERAAALTSFGDKPLDDIITRNDAGNEATITISGPLSPAGPSPIARFFGFGGTGYVDIISAAKTLENDPSIETVRLAMDTPGGTVAGMDQARQALESLAIKKTVIPENHGQIASAGYYLAAIPNTEIVAMSPLAKIGSIGVIIAGLDFSDAMARDGVKRIKIVSKNAPNKQADPTTPHGLSVLQDEVDATERVFIQKIAEGRGTTEADIIENFGQGGMLIAQDPDPEKPDALKVGMIDKVITNSVEPVIDESENELGTVSNSDAINEDSNILATSAAEGGGQQQGAEMDLKTLRAEHPALIAQAVAEGVEQGVTNERERVDAHLTMGKASGDMDLAVSCISEGAEHTAATNAKYMASQMNKGATGDRASESEDELDTEASETDDAETHDKAVAKATAELLGVDDHA